MKRVVLAVLLMLFAAFAALWTYVQSEAFSERIRPWVAGPLQEALGPKARIGRVKATLLPVVLEVRDIAIPTEQSAEGIAVRKVRLYINPLSLLFRTIDITSVTVLEPRISAVREPDGAIDLQELVRGLRADIERRPRNGSTSYGLRVRSLVVRAGQVRFADTASGVRASLADLDLRASVSAEAPAGVMRITAGTLRVVSPSYPPVEASLSAEGAFDAGSISLTTLDLRGGTARASVSGTISLEAAGPVDLRFTVRTAAGPARLLKRETDRGPSLEAAAALTGTLTEPRWEGTLRIGTIPFGGMVLRKAGLQFAYARGKGSLAGEDWQLERSGRKYVLQQVQAEAEYQDGVLRIVSASLRTADLTARANGTVSPGAGMNLSLSADIAEGGGAPAFLTGLDAAGAASVTGTLTGAAKTLAFEGTVSAGPLTVRGTTFQSLTGLLRYQDRTLSLAGATVRQNDSRYLFDGSVSFRESEPQFEARLGVVRSDVVGIVAVFYKRIPLALNASGELYFSGTRGIFRGTGQLSLEAGTAYGESFDRGSLSVELTSSRVVFPRVVLEKGGGQVTGRGWIGFDGTYFGQVEANSVDLERIDQLAGLKVSGPADLSILSSGRFTEPVVQARVTAPRTSHPDLGAGALTGELSISERRLTVSAAFDGEPDRSVRAQAVMRLERAYAWTGAASFRVRDAGPSAFTGGNDLLSKLRVTTEGKATLQGEGFDPDRISGSLDLSRLALSLQESRIENEGDASFRIDRGALAVRRLQLTGAGTKLRITGALQPFRTFDLSLSGDVNLSLVRLLYREVEHGDGIASVRLTVRDEWQSPHVEGDLSIQDGLIKVRDVPQRFSAINGTVRFDRDRIVTERLTAEAGGGRISISGSAQLKGTDLVEFSTRTTVESVTVRYPPGLTATLGGTLYYDGDASTQLLSGELTLQRARYEKRIEWKSMLVDVTRGITRRRKTDIGWIGDTQLNIRFIGSEQVLFENNLAKIPLTMDMLFRGTVNQLQVLGRIEAREGEVYFRNNVFRILYASTDFVDPNRLNPVLDVQAETRVREYRIRLAVSGTADRAVVAFLSDPPLADSDILALLALGRRGEELKGREANIGMGESLSFATGKFQDLLESRARSITGLDRFQVDPYLNKDDTAVPRVTVGKELLQDRFYLTYSSNVGGTTPEQNVRVEYILNRNFSLIGEYDELGQIGADLKLRFEFR